jgi:hypothetical protein
MSSFSDEENTVRLFVTKDEVKPEILGRGNESVLGAAYLQGPVLVGSDVVFGSISGTLMVGPLSNSNVAEPPEFAISTIGSVFVEGEVIASVEVEASGITLTSRKPFDIPHPNKKEWRLRHVCLEGPESGIYFRGRVRNKTEILLPNYWKNFVDINSITVNLTPIGSHQDVIVKRWDEKKIYLQSKGGMPIDCFYYICAERIDGEKLIVEYEGKTIDDYPGDNSIYSINK